MTYERTCRAAFSEGEASPCAAMALRRHTRTTPSSRGPVPKLQRSIAVLLLGSGVSLGCEVAMPSPDLKAFQALEKAIESAQFEEAKNILQEAQQQSPQSQSEILQLNASLLDISRGNCSLARDRLSQALKRLQSQELRRALHLAMAQAAYCIALQMEGTSAPSLELHPERNRLFNLAVEQLLQAANMGIDSSPMLAKVLKNWLLPCSSYRNPQIRAATRPEYALDWDLRHILGLTVCPGEELWLKLPIRVQSLVQLHANLTPLNRRHWPDQSSQLPYSQISMAIFLQEEEGSELERYAEVQQPLPKSSVGARFEAAELNMPWLTITKHFKQAYLRLKSERLGEAHVQLIIRRAYDCALHDDRESYSLELEQQRLLLGQGDRYNNLILCPKRPDKLSLNLPAQSEAALVLMLKDVQTQDFQIRLPKEIELYDAQEISQPLEAKPLPETPFDAYQGALQYVQRERGPAQPMLRAWILQSQEFTAPTDAWRDSPEDEILIPWMILIQNGSSQAQSFELELSTKGSALPYLLRYGLSEPCPQPEKPSLILPALFKPPGQIAQFAGPTWICPRTRQVFHNMQKVPLQHSSRLTPTTSLIASTALCENCLQLSHHYRDIQHDVTHEFPVEIAGILLGLWKKSPLVETRQLKRPIFENSQIVIQTGEQAGFYLMGMGPLQSPPSSGEKNDRQDKENEAQKEEERAEEREKQEQAQSEEKKKEEEQASSEAQEESREKTEAKSAGHASDGRESSPDEEADNQNASKYDPEAYEKAQIDALLNELERGGIVSPHGNSSQEALRSDKAW